MRSEHDIKNLTTSSVSVPLKILKTKFEVIQLIKLIPSEWFYISKMRTKFWNVNTLTFFLAVHSVYCPNLISVDFSFGNKMDFKTA